MDAHRGAAHDQQVSRRRRGHTVAEVVQVVWDPCGCGGCGGCCGLRWFDAGEVARMVAAGRPSVHRKDPVAHLSAWAADDGPEVLLAVASVRWGGLLA